MEETFGHAKTALLLGLFAVGSAAFDFAFADGGVGLSGVVYGLVGMLWVLWRRDARFHNAINRSTILLFAGWFAFCVFATVKDIFPVDNVAHGAGFTIGVLVGFALTSPPPQRWLVGAALAGILLFGFWGATLGRPTVNLSSTAGYEEAKWGYDALMAHHDQEAIRWLRDATRYQPRVAEYWVDLGIAYERLGNAPAARTVYERARRLARKNPAPAQTPERAD